MVVLDKDKNTVKSRINVKACGDVEGSFYTLKQFEVVLTDRSVSQWLD